MLARPPQQPRRTAREAMRPSGQTGFGVQPVSFFAGALLVTDDVTVELSATRR
jgi:hypothetical protein